MEGLRQYSDKAHSSITTEFQLLVDKKIFTHVEAWKLLPQLLMKAIWSSMFWKEKFAYKDDFGGDQKDRALYGNMPMWMTCKDKVSIAGVIETVNAKFAGAYDSP